MSENSGVFSTALRSTVIPLAIFALVFAMLVTDPDWHDTIILTMYAGIGFFGALAFLYFFGGYILYEARMGQEYRQEGIYHMLHGVRILIYVLLATILLYWLE